MAPSIRQSREGALEFGYEALVQRGRLMDQLIVDRRLGGGIVQQVGGQCDGAG